jgi:DNA invertase Pin-like site-specific DNA recombinase
MVIHADGAASSPTRAIGYRRVSTAEQVESGAGLAAQLSTIEAECARRGWRLVEVFTDEGTSGKSLKDRDGLTAAIDAVESGRADALVVAKLDRLSRSLLDFAAIMGRAQERKWNLVALDLGIDLSTPAGEFLASVMASAAQWERRIIGQRTRDALAAKRAAGVRLGRPRVLPDRVIQRILTLRSGGSSWREVAELLNAERVPTARGGDRWYASTARGAVASFTGQEAKRGASNAAR